MKNLKLLVGACSGLLLVVAGLQGCSSDDVSVKAGGGAAGKSSSEAGAAGDSEAAGSGGAGEAGEGGMGGAAGSGEVATQAELCEKFCTDESVICTGDLQPYESLEDCAAKCNQFARGTAGDTTGNTLECRIYHLNAAAMSAMNATTHCPHTAAVPKAFCIN